ncbi:MAG: hypothetical protein Q9162_005802 [Coniocarpon cinnabarinum]
MSTGHGQPTIAKLDYPEDDDADTPLLQRRHGDEEEGASSAQPPFWEQVAEELRERDNRNLKREAMRYVSFFWAVVCTYVAFSGAKVLRIEGDADKHTINIVSITAELAMYLPVPLFGLLVDRRGPPPLALIAAFLFGAGYILAAFTYNAGPPMEHGGDGWPLAVMVVAFIGVGTGTSCLYLAAVTTCAKNFGRGKHKGIALALPIACFGLSGMWQSQVGANLLYEQNPDGSRGDVDVFRYFIFLGALLFTSGFIGMFLLKIVDEETMIDEAVESLEASGLIEDSAFFHPQQDYGTVPDNRRPSTAERAAWIARKARKANERRKKSWLLNEETRRFLQDPTMWFLSAGFFLVTGTGETFINNLGTIIGTLYPPPSQMTDTMAQQMPATSPATHVSIVAIASTIARIASGTLSDILGPRPIAPRQHHTSRQRPASLSSVSSLDPLARSTGSLPVSQTATRRFQISRMTLLVSATLLLSLGQVLLASGIVQNHAAGRFWSISALIGTGYGAAFALVPIIISCVWGVENFGTNWGIVATAPAFGSAVWGIVYAWVYEWAASGVGKPGGWDSKLGSWLDEGVRIGMGVVEGGDKEYVQSRNGGKCYGHKCYESTFWGMAVATWIAVALWLWAWRGPNGWREKGVRV